MPFKKADLKQFDISKAPTAWLGSGWSSFQLVISNGYLVQVHLLICLAIFHFYVDHVEL